MKDLFEQDLFERLLLEMFNAFRRRLKLHLERVDKPLDVNELVVSGLLRELADALDNGDVKLVEGD